MERKECEKCGKLGKVGTLRMEGLLQERESNTTGEGKAKMAMDGRKY